MATSSTSRSQRIGIWVIAIIMAVGTIGSFVVIVLAQQNQKIDDTAQSKALADQEAEYKKAAEDNAKNSEPLKGYKPTKFNAKSVTKVKTEVLVAGKGEALKETDFVNASYFGWTSDGKIFDSSDKKDAKDEPVTFSLSGVIEGWRIGLKGVKVGSTVKLTIPAKQAYGATGSYAIAPNQPLQFIVKIHSAKDGEV